MQMVDFITFDDLSKPPKERKAVLWYRTNDIKAFRDFIQYVLDSCYKPEEFFIVETETGLSYDMYGLATERFGMRKRTFHERMKNISTGIWAEGKIPSFIKT